MYGLLPLNIELTKYSVMNPVSNFLPYGQEKIISGVQLIDFDFYSDNGGDFHEIIRLTKGFADGIQHFELRQINRSRFNPETHADQLPKAAYRSLGQRSLPLATAIAGATGLLPKGT